MGTIMINPPFGKRYGFPRPFPDEVQFTAESLRSFLEFCGYPMGEDFDIDSVEFWVVQTKG